MKTERELFEGNIHPRILSWVYFCNDSDGYKFKIVTCDTDKYRALSELNFGWKMWQASALREGYKLVPVEATEKMLEALQVGFVPDYEGGSYDSHEGYKAMIGAVE